MSYCIKIKMENNDKINNMNENNNPNPLLRK